MDGQRSTSALYSMMPHDSSPLVQVPNGTSKELSSKDLSSPPAKESPSPPLKDACPSKDLSSEAVSSIAQRKRETFAERRTITISISIMDYPGEGNIDKEEKKGKTLEEDKEEDYNPVGALAFDTERGFTGYNYKTLVEIPHHKEITTTKLPPKESKNQWQMNQHQTLPILEDDNPVGALDMEREFIGYKALVLLEKLHSRQHRPPNQPTPHPYHLVEEPHHKETATMKLVRKGRFFKKQWQMKQHQTIPILATALLFVMFALLHELLLLKRRSGQKRCIEAKLVVDTQPKIESTEVQGRQSPCDADDACDADDEGPVCWICLEEGPDESGHQLRRDCSCRGESAGFAHISCLVDYAEQKNEQWDGHDPNKFREPWEFCANCHQGYQNDLAVDLASKFVTFVERKYPDKQCPLHLEALVLKLETLRNMASRLQPKQKQEVKKIASNVLFMAEKMKKKYSSLPKRIILAEAVTYSILGRFIFLEGTEESFKAAVVCFEKCRDANEAIGNTSGITLAETYLAYAKSKCEGGSQVSIETVLEKLQQVYEHRVEIFGENAPWTLSAGVDFALTLEKANRLLEAERLLTKLAVISKRVHGPDHQLTKKAASHLELWTKRYVMVSCQHQWFLFQALRYEEDGKECVVKGPIATPRNIQDETSFTVATEDIRPTMDSPVICHGLKSSPHLNGKVGDVGSLDKDTGLYQVHFEDKDLEPCLVNHGNMRILFELPVEKREEVVLPPVEAPLTLPGEDEAAAKALSSKGQVTIYHE